MHDFLTEIGLKVAHDVVASSASVTHAFTDALNKIGINNLPFVSFRMKNKNFLSWYGTHKITNYAIKIMSFCYDDKIVLIFLDYDASTRNSFGASNRKFAMK